MKLRFVLCAVMLSLAIAAPASAHQGAEINGVEIEVGWLIEPVIAGAPNAVILEAEDADNVKVSVEVGFGDRVMDKMALEPALDEPGLYQASIIPTAPGTYTFHMTGTLGGKTFDQTFTSGEKTFDDVTAPSEVSFPDQPPSQVELQQRADRVDQRLIAAAAAAKDDAKSATTIAWIGVGLGALGILVGLFGRRRKQA
jgi:hypothetical protein